MSDALDMKRLVAATAAIPDTPLEYTADGWCVLSRDPVSGREIHALDDGDRMHIREVQDVEPLVEQNNAIRSALAGRRHGDGLSLAASIPEHIFHNRLAEAMRQGDSAYVRRWLMDSDHAAFRVRDRL